MLSGRATIASSQSFSMIQRRMLLSPWPASPVNRELPVVHLGDAAAECGVLLHLGELAGQEQHLAVAGAGHQGVLGIARVFDHEAGVAHVALAAHALQVGLPALAVGRIGEHEVELAARVGVVGQGGVLGAAHDVVGGLAVPLQQQVSLADGEGLGVDLLPVQVG